MKDDDAARLLKRLSGIDRNLGEDRLPVHKGYVAHPVMDKVMRTKLGTNVQFRTFDWHPFLERLEGRPNCGRVFLRISDGRAIFQVKFLFGFVRLDNIRKRKLTFVWIFDRLLDDSRLRTR